MDLRQLRYFIAIAEQGSFSKAATLLNVAQPALSLHVRNMEADLNTLLLFRSPQGVVPTEAGNILLKNARIILDQLTVTIEEIRGSEAHPAGEVRLGLPGTISQILSVPLITAARKHYPGIKLRIAEAMSGFVLEWMSESRIDLAVLYVNVEDRALSSACILSEELCLFGPKEPLLDVAPPPAGTSILYRDVTKLPLILPSPHHGLRILLEREASALSLSLNTTIDVDSYANIKELVEEGMGYSILPYHAIAQEVQEERLLSWSIREPVPQRDVHIVYANDRPMTNAVKAIQALCRDTLLSLASTGRWVGVKQHES